MVASSADVVQRRRPSHVVAFLVGPGGHGREVARWVVADHRVIIGREDGTDGVEDIWFEMRLSDGRNYLMAFTGLRYYDVAKSTEVNVPAAPHARAPGRLLRPAMAATWRKRKERMLRVWTEQRTFLYDKRYTANASGQTTVASPFERCAWQLLTSFLIWNQFIKLPFFGNRNLQRHNKRSIPHRLCGCTFVAFSV